MRRQQPAEKYSQGSPEESQFSEFGLARGAARTNCGPAGVPAELFRSLREHFDPRQMVELTVAIACESWRARINRGFGIEVEGFAEGDACPVHWAKK